MELITGKKYQAFFSGTELKFDIEIIEKPSHVFIDGKKKAPMPDHLKKSEWYCAKKISTGLLFWLFEPNYDLIELAN